MAKKKQDEESIDTNGWIATYTDLMTLLLTFFVLLLSMSTISHVRVYRALKSLTGAFGLLPAGRSPIGTVKGIDVRNPTAPMLPSHVVNLAMLRQRVIRNHLSPDIAILHQKEKLVIRIDQRVLFLPNSTTLNPKIYNFLTMLAHYLKQKHGDIAIRGYTDTYEGVNHPDWPEYSWELSTERAMAVYDFFLKHNISHKRMSAHGYSFYHPIIHDLTCPELSYKNRRVAIMLGGNPAIPSSLLHEPLKQTPYLEYKNFLFRLFPSSRHKPTNSKQQSTNGEVRP